VSAQTILAAFNRVRGLLLPAMAAAEAHEDVWAEDEVLNELLCGRAQLWAGDRAAVVTRCFAEPPSLHVWLAGGSLRDVLDLLPGAVAWARPLGLQEVSCLGRPGWKRALRTLGFEGETVLRRGIS
jgi:hypothetical protein